MSIRDKRAEILHLIEQVNRDGRVRIDKLPLPDSVSDAVRGARPRPRKEPRPSQRRTVQRAARLDHLDDRRKKLAELERQRERVEVTRSEERVLDALKRLEERIEQIEVAMLAGGRPATAAAPTRSAGELPERVTSGVGYTLGGKLRDGLLCDLLQLVSSSSMTGIFAVDDGTGEIRLYFRDGEIHHAAGADLEGESAVFALMARESGTYWFKETTDAPDLKTVHSKTQFLILEALRRIDEERAHS